jgi:two-component system cell cycle sensor histidine kinase/response regulator CckA
MLHQKLPAIDSNRLDGWGRWLAPALTLGAGLTVALLLLLLGQAPLAAVAAAAGVAGAALAFAKAPGLPSPDQPLVIGPDYSILGSALGLSLDPTALTTSEGSVLIVNAAYRERFGGNAPPLSLAADDEARQGLELARTMAWRDGAGCVAGIATGAGTTPVEVERVGAHGEHLLWRFPQAPMPDPLTSAVKRVQGLAGESFGKARVMAAVVDENGRVMAANRLFLDRGSAKMIRCTSLRTAKGRDRCARCTYPPTRAAKARWAPSFCSRTTPRHRSPNPRTCRRSSMCFPWGWPWSIATGAS